MSLNSSLPPHRGQGSSLTSSGFTVAPKVGRKYAVSANQFKRKNAVCIGLVSETQKFGGFAQVNDCPSDRNPVCQLLRSTAIVPPTAARLSYP